MAKPPGSMCASCRLRGKYFLYSLDPQFPKADLPTLPLFPQKAAQSPSNPTLQIPENAGGLAECEVTSPPKHVGTKLFNHPLDTDSACAPCQLSNTFLE